MSKALSFKEFAEVVNFITKWRSFIKNKENFPYVKYIDPVFDMRTNSVFTITFRGSEEKRFSSVNEERDLPQSMYVRIMEWLMTEKETDDSVRNS